ncbi:MAG: nuclear transport factor 2 family protein [Deltaproteobacteria bacterium]|nr:nuclear transport factor 2 family protein [Deltaproteobacteria bacterium]MBW2665584.1 nuclear transport factor 2 family protein [Deltaproteobacteria bacterium]
MGSFKRDEIEQAFRKYWHAGAVAEDWNGFAEMFTEDAQYVEHVLGSMRGREAIRSWIVPIMEQYCELYTAYEWHTVDEDADRVIVYMQNRRDHPSGSGTIDFPGITILHYAGGGLFDLEEDFWSVPGGQATTVEYAAACEQHDPEHRQKRTRLHWGDGPEWTRGAKSYFER